MQTVTLSLCLAVLLLCGCQRNEPPPTIIVAPGPVGEPVPPGAPGSAGATGEAGKPGINAAVIVVTPAASAAPA